LVRIARVGESRYGWFLNEGVQTLQVNMRYLTDLDHRHRRGQSRRDRLLRGFGVSERLAALSVLG
jgi:hypothetical protein